MRYHEISEMYGEPLTPSADRQQKLRTILHILDQNPRIQPFRERIIIFGSVARGNLDAGDVDIMLDYSDRNIVVYHRVDIPGVDIFLTLGRRYYGYVDVFIKGQNTMAVRDADSRHWQVAKLRGKLWQAAKTEGKSLAEVLTLWDHRTTAQR